MKPEIDSEEDKKEYEETRYRNMLAREKSQKRTVRKYPWNK